MAEKKPCKKKTYKIEASAIMVLVKALRSKKHERQEVRHYYCNECRGWHLTSKK